MTIKGTARIIKGRPSILLDSLRIFAALVVFYIHAFDKWFPKFAHPHSEPGEPSHAAVVIFFVLSGYVIAHTTISNNRGGRQYAQARLSRLCAIVIPVLIITALIQLIVNYINPAMLAGYIRPHSWVRYLASGLLINELWFFSAAPPINIALWSLSYEFWYYAIFGLWFFRRQGWKSYALLLLTLLIVGPKILLLMPVWLIGYAAYILPRPKINTGASWFFVFAGLVLAWLAVAYTPYMPYKVGYEPLFGSNQFFTDWISGIFIAAALWILPTVDAVNSEMRFSNLIRKSADLTFPLYVLHYPLLVMWRGIFGFEPYNKAQFWVALISVLVIASIIGVLLEMQRHLWTRFFKRLLGSTK